MNDPDINKLREIEFEKWPKWIKLLAVSANSGGICNSFIGRTKKYGKIHGSWNWKTKQYDIERI